MPARTKMPHYPAGRRFLEFSQVVQDGLFKNYIAQMQGVAAMAGEDKPFLVWAGDNRRSFSIPTLVRSRTIEHPGLGVLQRFRPPPRVPETRDLTESDIPFRDKADRLVWRGMTTGRFHAAPGELGYGPRYYVARALKRIDDPSVDIGYSSRVQHSLMSRKTRADVDAAMRPSLLVEEMLKARYILSLEGNDIATGLRWALHSNSCVVMPAPTAESWLMEAQLVPMEHYVPVAPNLHNLAATLAWCRSNIGECEKIAANGREFMARLLDEDSETALSAEVAKTFFSKVKLVPKAGSAFPDTLF
ncbi:MAG: glycosyl transferase family 90 [Pseudomonadota bacterium]